MSASTLKRAAHLLDSMADGLHQARTRNGEWPKESRRDRDAFFEYRSVARDLRKMATAMSRATEPRHD